jgi:hypothetical protein
MPCLKVEIASTLLSLPSHTLIHRPSGVIVARLTRLDGWWAKGVGVIGMRSLSSHEGVWLPGVSAVHTLFVRFPLDLLFLDDDLRTVGVMPNFPTWRPLAWRSGARHTLELGADSLVNSAIAVQRGDSWDISPSRV